MKQTDNILNHLCQLPLPCKVMQSQVLGMRTQKDHYSTCANHVLWGPVLWPQWGLWPFSSCPRSRSFAQYPCPLPTQGTTAALPQILLLLWSYRVPVELPTLRLAVAVAALTHLKATAALPVATTTPIATTAKETNNGALTGQESLSVFSTPLGIRGGSGKAAARQAEWRAPSSVNSRRPLVLKQLFSLEIILSQWAPESLLTRPVLLPAPDILESEYKHSWDSGRPGNTCFPSIYIPRLKNFGSSKKLRERISIVPNFSHFLPSLSLSIWIPLEAICPNLALPINFVRDYYWNT